MIHLTRFDGSHLYLNADLIEVVESTPDTHITLVNGHRYLVREKDEEVVRRATEYQQRVSTQGLRSVRNLPSPLRVVNAVNED